ncbi:MAG: hypothetical protein JNL94_07185 [Planctomycetes bacterium]|nr:hypothetical protein [Planctomycetota bacterium]
MNSPNGRPLEFTTDPFALAELTALNDVQFRVVPLPDGQVVHVVLHREAIPVAPDAVHVDGKAAPHSLDVTLWTGHVVGDDASAVYFAFSRYGSRGFVRTQDRHFELLAGPDATGDWSNARSYFVSESMGVELGSSHEPSCAGWQLPAGQPAPDPRLGASNLLAATTVVPIYDAKLAVETDTQFHALFGNLTAAQTYLTSVLGAVSNRYREQVGVILTYVYVGYHTTTDVWVTPDTGGGTSAMLTEFQQKWSTFGGAPVSANTYHFVSGATLGGGTAFYYGVCDPFSCYGVSGNIGGNTPIPVTQGSLTWDFVVIAHEIGHNFGALHTHEYCPPLDQCAPAGKFGPCQTKQTCTNQGTIMSYCHVCSGGMNNITTFFHPQSVTDMRNFLAFSCLPYFEGLTQKWNLGYAKLGSNGTPALDVTYTAAGNIVTFTVTHAPISKVGVFFIAEQKVVVPFFGGTLVPNVQIMVQVVSNASGNIVLAAPVPSSTPIPGGATLYAQVWFADVAPYYPAVTNGIEFELIVP